MDPRQDAVPTLIRVLAVPASVGMMFSVLLNVTDTWYAGLLSPTALAALSLAGPVFFLVMTLGIGVGQATNARYERVRESYRTGLSYALAPMVGGGVVLAAFARPPMAQFTDDAEVISIGVTRPYFEAAILPAYALAFLSAATLQGSKRPEIAMHFNVVRQVIGQLVLFWIAVEVIGSDITGLWWSVLIVNWALAVAIVAVVRRFLADVESLPRPRSTLLAPDPDAAPDPEPAE